MRKSTQVFASYLLVLISSNFLNSKASTVSTLLPEMLKDNYFASCELIFVNVQEERDQKNDRNSRLMLQEDVLPYRNSWGSSGAFSIVRSSSSSQEKIKFRRLQDIHRFSRKHCGVALLLISDVTPNLSKWLFETITPPYVPIIRKDEDPFVFIFETEKTAQEMLLSHRFGNKIRFKIGILPSDEPVIKTVHLYGNAGQPIIKPIKVGASGISSLFPDSTRNFHRRKLRVANPKAPSHFEMQTLPNGKEFRAVRGIYKVWLDVMMERFNFTVKLRLSSYFGGTGKRLKNGTWLGAVADVLYDHADMASFNGHIYNRHTVVDWSAPVTYEWMAFITHKPQSFFSPSAIFRPFPIVLWVGFILSVILISLMFKVFVNLNPGVKYYLPFRKMLLYFVASFLEQDSNYYMYVLHLSPIRALVSFWLLFAMIFSTAYRGKLVSLIAFPALSWVPTNFEELAYSNYRVGLNTLGKGGAVYSVLSTSNSPVYQLIFKRLEIYPDSVKCLSEALHHDFGCIMVKSIGDVVAYKNFTDKFGRSPFQESDQMTLFHADGYIWEKQAVFRQNFDRITWFIMETGLNGFWFQKDLDSLKQKRMSWERETGNMTVIRGYNEGPTKLKLAHLKGLFYLFITGVSFGSLCLLTELYRRSEMRNQRNYFRSVTDALLYHMKMFNRVKTVKDSNNFIELVK